MHFRHFRNLFLFVAFVFISCEYLIYYLVIWQCSWPLLQRKTEEYGNRLSALFFADPHLLGSKQGHWFDQLRREWQMQRAFQTAVSLLQPDIIFVLGDLLDEGQWASNQEFHETVGRFKHMFRHSEKIQLHVVVGNHDIGFHPSVRQTQLERFQTAFDIPSVKTLTVKGINFVLLNSILMQGDKCSMCLEAEVLLRQVSQQLNCSRDMAYNAKHPEECDNQKLLPTSAPILLQHFPMYRESDAVCTGEDAAPSKEKLTHHRERWEVLSKDASQKLFWWLQPRFILSGHTHHGCHLEHENGTPELTVPSFSWRNRNNPSFALAVISPDDIAFNKCFIPRETTVIFTYIISGVVVVMMVIFINLKPPRRRYRYKTID